MTIAAGEPIRHSGSGLDARGRPGPGTTCYMAARSNQPADIELKKRVSYLLRRAADQRGLTIPEAAERVGVVRSTFLKWTKGESSPSILDLGRICRGLGIDCTAFADPPPIPEDPYDRFLTDGVSEGLATARERRRRRPSPQEP